VKLGFATSPDPSAVFAYTGMIDSMHFMDGCIDVFLEIFVERKNIYNYIFTPSVIMDLTVFSH
jgi:hypothetical protein